MNTLNYSRLNAMMSVPRCRNTSETSCSAQQVSKRPSQDRRSMLMKMTKRDRYHKRSSTPIRCVDKVNEESTQMKSNPAETDDFWAGDQWNAVGFVFQNFVYIAGLLVALAGGLAAKSYNDGATSFLAKPTSPADSAKIISLEEVQKARRIQQ